MRPWRLEATFQHPGPPVGGFRLVGDAEGAAGIYVLSVSRVDDVGRGRGPITEQRACESAEV